MSLAVLLPHAGRDPATTFPGADLVDVSGHDTAYAEMFLRWWRTSADLLIIEHDMIVPAEAVVRMVMEDGPTACPYVGFPIKTGHPEPIYAAWNKTAGGTDQFFVQWGEPYAEYTGLGCVYIPARHLSRHVCPPSDKLPDWKHVDNWIGNHVQRFSPVLKPWRLLWALGVTHETPTEGYPDAAQT